jgi:hypothetical protein
LHNASCYSAVTCEKLSAVCAFLAENGKVPPRVEEFSSFFFRLRFGINGGGVVKMHGNSRELHFGASAFILFDS